MAEDGDRVLGQLGPGEQLGAGLAVAGEVPAVDGELAAHVGNEHRHRHLPAGPGDDRFGLPGQYLVEEGSQLRFLDVEALAQDWVVHGPVRGFPLLEALGGGHLLALEIGVQVTRDLDGPRDQVGDDLMGRPTVAGGDHLRRRSLQGIEEGFGLQASGCSSVHHSRQLLVSSSCGPRRYGFNRSSRDELFSSLREMPTRAAGPAPLASGGHRGDVDLAAVGALVGDRTRAQVLLALDDGRARTAGDLAALAGVSKATISAHLAKLVAGGLILVETRGRHRHFRIAGPQVARAIESLLLVAPDQPVRSLRGADVGTAMRFARLCYDHLAGQLGVAVLDALCAEGLVDDDGDGYRITCSGEAALARFAIDVAALQRARRSLARGCLDWSERRPHLAGAVGAALAARFLELDWLVRRPIGRAVMLTEKGTIGFRETFGVST